MLGVMSWIRTQAEAAKARLVSPSRIVELHLPADQMIRLLEHAIEDIDVKLFLCSETEEERRLQIERKGHVDRIQMIKTHR